MRQQYTIQAYDEISDTYGVLSNDGLEALSITIPTNIVILNGPLIGKTISVSYMNPIVAEPVGLQFLNPTR